MQILLQILKLLQSNVIPTLNTCNVYWKFIKYSWGYLLASFLPSQGLWVVVKVPWRAVSVYFAATVSIQQSTQSQRIWKLCSIPFAMEIFLHLQERPPPPFRRYIPSMPTHKHIPFLFTNQHLPPWYSSRYPSLSSPIPQHNLSTAEI